MDEFSPHMSSITYVGNPKSGLAPGRISTSVSEFS